MKKLIEKKKKMMVEKKKMESGDKESGSLGDKWKNEYGMEFVYIKPGRFMMGSSMKPEELAKRYGGEAEDFDVETAHEVTLTKGFYIQTTELTQKQWTAVRPDETSPGFY